MGQFDVDLFVIGAGSGGVRAARIAAGYGAKVAIAEESRFGGTCVHRGCVPKKLMRYAALASDELEAMRPLGWAVDKPDFDWPTVRKGIHSELDRLQEAYIRNLEKPGVELYRGRAHLEDAHTVAISDGTRLTAERILISVGGRPRMLDVPGRELTWSSDDVFHMETLPESLLVLGGGYIAVEFASMFKSYGTDVTIGYRGTELLNGFEDDLRRQFASFAMERGIHVERRFPDIERFEKDGDGRIRTVLSDGRSFLTDAVLQAVGRVPNTEGLGLDAAGVAMDGAGAIVVHDDSQSMVSHIYAVGDVTNRMALTPVAIREGHAFADTVYGGKRWTVDYANVPTAIFSTPELGTVGLTEKQAADRGWDLDIYTAEFTPLKNRLSGEHDKMFMKLVVSDHDQKVLGCHLAGHEAGELIQLAAIPVRMGATKADFDSVIAVHPTSAEELVTMKEPRKVKARASRAA